MNKREIKFKFEGTLHMDVDRISIFKQEFPKEDWIIEDFDDFGFDMEAQNVHITFCVGDIINGKGEVTHVECEPIIDEKLSR